MQYKYSEVELLLCIYLYSCQFSTLLPSRATTLPTPFLLEYYVFDCRFEGCVFVLNLFTRKHNLRRISRAQEVLIISMM